MLKFQIIQETNNYSKCFHSIPSLYVIDMPLNIFDTMYQTLYVTFVQYFNKKMKMLVFIDFTLHFKQYQTKRISQYSHPYLNNNKTLSQYAFDRM